MSLKIWQNLAVDIALGSAPKMSFKTSASEAFEPHAKNDSEGQWLRREQVRNMVARELNAPIDDICKDFVKRAQQIAGKKGDGH